jgi:uncharacterized membrane protein YkgB
MKQNFNRFDYYIDEDNQRLAFQRIKKLKIHFLINCVLLIILLIGHAKIDFINQYSDLIFIIISCSWLSMFIYLYPKYKCSKCNKRMIKKLNSDEQIMFTCDECKLYLDSNLTYRNPD